MIEEIKHNSKLLSIIIRAAYHSVGIEFFTPNHYPQQLAYMNRGKGYKISPHLHTSVERNVHVTQEVLFIRKGKVRVDYYDDDKNYLQSKILKKGDVVLMACGGHGFQMLEDSEIIEVKQGPYLGDDDKNRFNATEPLNKIK